MPIIITNSEAQKNIGVISRTIGSDSYIVTNNGKARMIILPYFQAGDGLVDDYLEDYEMSLHQDQLTNELKKSLTSGKSDVVI